MRVIHMTIAAGIALAWPWVPTAQVPVPAPVPDEAAAQARALVEDVLGEAGAGNEAELEAWAQSVVGEALTRAGLNGEPGGERPALEPERNAAALAASLTPKRAGTAEVIVFASLSVPEPSWRQWSLQAARIGTPLVLRGVAGGGFAATVNRIAARRSQDGAGAVIDPRLFRLFRIGSVPAVAVVPGGVAPCESPGCSTDAAPPHDLVTGNVGLDGALEAIAREGGPGRETARRFLALLRGEME